MPTNRALVIGIDRYATELSSLSGAVADAQAFAAWLITAGEVLPEDVHLGLLPGEDAPHEPAALAGCARVGTTLSALDSFLVAWLESPPADTGRFYFFFSGHGVASSNPAYNEEAICLEGFRDDAMRNALEISSLMAALNALPADERFIFIDGCRNAAFNERARFGALSVWPRAAAAERRNYVLRATGPGRAAAEVSGRGLFSRFLCEGLLGAGSAKRWDPTQAGGDGAYVVRWRALADHVFAQVTPQRAAQRQEQLIFEEGQHPANEDPVLANFAEGHFGLSTMTVSLADPSTPPAQTTVFLRRNDSADPDRSAALSSNGTVEFSVPPSAWMLWASASGWRSLPKSKPVSVYAPQVDERITLVPDAGTAPAPVSRGGRPAVVMLGSQAKPPAPSGPGRLRITVGGRWLEELHPPVRVAVRHESGKLVDDPVRRDVLPLEPGVYRVRLDVASGAWTEATVLIAPGEEETLDLPLPEAASPALEQILSAGGKPPSAAGFALPSEMLGWLAAPSAATVAALAVAQQVQDHQGGLTGLGIGWRWANSEAIGIEVTSVSEDDTHAGGHAHVADFAGSAPLGVRLWRMAEGVDQAAAVAEPLASSAVAPIASLSHPAEPGGYWLVFGESNAAGLDGADGGPRLATQVLAGHVTLVVRQRRPSREGWLLQFAVRREPSARREIQLGLVQGEALQRALAAGRDPLVDPSVLGLAEGRWFEPFSALVAAAALLARGDAAHALFQPLMAVLIARDLRGPDIAVLRAARATLAGQDDLAAALLRDVLGMGVVPLVDSLLERLVGEVRRLRCADGAVRRDAARGFESALRQSIGHPLWTVCRSPRQPK